MKNRLLLLNILSLLLYGCNLNYKTKQSLNEEAIKATKTNQTDLIPATEDNCIQTEGDYLTQHYCINITHTSSKSGEYYILMQIDQLPPSCLLYTSPSPRDRTRSRMPSSA